MSTSRRRKWFRGAQITGRLLAVPLFAFMFSACGAGGADIGSYKPKTIDVSSYGSVGAFVSTGDWVVAEVGNYILKIDIDTMEVLDAINVNDFGFSSIQYSKLYVGNQKVLIPVSPYPGVLEYDTYNEKMKVLDIKPDSWSWTGFQVMTWDGENVYFSDGKINGTVWKAKYYEGDKIERVTSAQDASYNDHPHNCFYDGEKIYWTGKDSSSGTYGLITADTDLNIESSVKLEYSGDNISPLAWGFTYDGRYVWFIGQNLTDTNFYLYKLDLSDGSILAQIDFITGFGSPLAYKTIFDGRYIYIDNAGNELSRVDIVENAISGTIPMPHPIRYTCFDGLNLWGGYLGDISRIPL